MHLRALAILALAAIGCASESPAEVTLPASPAPEVAAEAAPGCSVVFSPDAELEAETAEAAARWSLATGCDIRVGEGGIRVRLVEEQMPTPSGTMGHGHTYCPGEACKRSELVIDVAREHVARTIAHEMGHALGSTAGHVEDDESALMFHTGGLGLITSPDLVLVCTVLDCSVITPEG